jgi:hypothetical protein
LVYLGTEDDLVELRDHLAGADKLSNLAYSFCIHDRLDLDLLVVRCLLDDGELLVAVREEMTGAKRCRIRRTIWR